MKIKTIDRPALRLIRDEALAALKPVGKSYGLGIAYAGGNFSDTEFTLKVTFTVQRSEEDNEKIAKREAKQYEIYRETYRLPKLGRKFRWGRHYYKVDGVKLGGRKGLKLWIKRIPDGKRFHASVEDVKMQIKLSKELEG